MAAPETSPQVGTYARWAPVVAIVGTLLLILVAYRWGRALQAQGYRMYINAPPLTGNIEPRLSLGSIAPIVLAGLGVSLAPAWSAKLRWRTLVVASTVVGFAWSVALAASDGTDGFLRSPTSSVDYLHSVDRVGSPISFLGSFVDQLPTLQGHAFSHPPGMVLLLWLIDRIGLGGPWPAALLGHLAGGASVMLALLMIRKAEGEAWARRAAPFLAFLPGAVFFGAVGDPVFMLLGVAGMALLLEGLRRESPSGTYLLLASGFVLGLACHFSYGMLLFVVASVALCIVRRRKRAAIHVLAGVAAVGLASGLAGFWWLEGFLAARPLILASVVRNRPYTYFFVANIAAVLIALGPAIWVALTTLPSSKWLLPGLGVGLVLVADISGLSKGETERIWLPFVPLLVSASGVFQQRARAWLGSQVAWSLLIQFLVRSPW